MRVLGSSSGFEVLGLRLVGLGFRVGVLVLLFQERLLLRIYVLDPSSQGLGFSILGDVA